MKQFKKFSIWSIIIVMFLTMLVGCAKETTTEEASGIYKPGTYSASSKGFGGDVIVTVTVDNNAITDAKIEGNSETPEVGGNAIKTMKELIVKNAEDFDSVSGATITSTAVKKALSTALAQARGEEINTALTIKDGTYEASARGDGTYEASARGFNLEIPVPVTVKVVDNRIDSISIGDNKETNGKPQVVEDNLIPRILESQSLEIDAITGATATSNAVLLAVHDCLIQAGADESALYAEIPKSSETEEYNVDVVVVGVGGSGLAAALSAAESGSKVMALEKAGRIGGTSAVTSGPMAVNPPSQVEKEIIDWDDPIIKEKRTKKAGEKLVDRDALYEDWIRYTTVDGVQNAKEEIISEAINQSGETIDWLSKYGFQFDNAKGFVGGKWAVFTSYTGNKSLTESFFDSALDKYTKELGGQYLLETEATELIVKDGKVVGVKAVKYDGTKVIVNANSVILATGGFGGSVEMMEKYLGESWMLYGTAQNKGAGIIMATSVGAATYNIDMAPMSHFSAPPVILTQFETAFDNDIPYGMINTSEILAVDKDGNRFVNEMNIGMEAYVGGSRFYSIYSKEQIDILREKGFAFDSIGRYLNRGGIKADIPMKNIDDVLQAGMDSGFIYKADSLEKLAEAIGSDNGKMSIESLTSAATDYNKGVASGNDVMGKAVERFKRLGEINTESEYYIAVTGAPYIYSTCGGLDVNESMQVLNTNGEVIDGLYAVGTDSMGVLFTDKKGYANYGGVAQGYCFTSGKIAGAHASIKK